MKISILGCGWFGLAFGKDMAAHGHDIKGSTTTAEKLPVLQQAGIAPYLIQLPGLPETILPAFFDCDVLVVTLPPGLRRQSAHTYQTMIDQVIAAAIHYQVPHLLYTSSSGVYGNDHQTVNEDTLPKPDKASGQLLWAIEKKLRHQTAFTTTIVRFAGLIGPGRHPAGFFAGKDAVPNGLAPVNLIHLNDCCGLCEAIISQHAFGYTINACAPDHPTKEAFYTAAAQQAGLPPPNFLPEKGNWKIVASRYVKPLLDYTFSFSLTKDEIPYLP